MKDTYKNKPRSRLFNDILRMGNVSRKEAASVLGITKHYLENKLARNSFSIEDIFKIAKYSNLSIFIEHDYLDGVSICLNNYFEFNPVLQDSEMVISFDQSSNLYSMEKSI